MSAPRPAVDGAASSPDLVFLYDVDNTLLNNDRLKADADTRLDMLLGIEWSDLFWRIYEDVRQEEDVVDIPEAIRRFESDCSNWRVCQGVRATFEEVDFPSYLYPGALAALRHTAQFGVNVVVSDGDPVFQRRKIEESGISTAAGGNVLIYVHKEEHTAKIIERFPGRRYIMVDDKPRILRAMPPRMPADLLTVFVCQGRYAHDATGRADFHPDLILSSIGDMCEYDAEEFKTGEFHRQGSCAIDTAGPRAS